MKEEHSLENLGTQRRSHYRKEGRKKNALPLKMKEEHSLEKL